MGVCLEWVMAACPCNRLVNPRGEYAVVVMKGKRILLARMVLLVPMELAMELAPLSLGNKELESAAVASQGQLDLWATVHTVLLVHMAAHMVHMELLVRMVFLVRMALLVFKDMAGERRAFVRSQ